MNSKLLDLVVCPKSQSKFKLEEGELFTDNTSYPLLNEIPWLFKNPEFSFLEWGTKITGFIEGEKRYLKFLEFALKGEINKISSNRINKIQEAKRKNLRVFEDQLAPFLGHKQIALTPSTQQIQSYFQLIFRDWCWDSDENDRYLEFIKQNLPADTKNILVLGAGACGLSYKIANAFQSTQVVSTDHNPFLFFMAHKIFKGHETKLTDYSFYPKNIASTTHHWHIKVPKLQNDNHHFVLSGFPDLPFSENTFDAIVAPWFLDILELSYPNALNHSLKYLKPDGKFIAIGPANVHKKNIYEQFCSDEQIAVFGNHFEKHNSEQQAIHYLANPIESQGRMEEVLFLCGETKIPREIKEVNEDNQILFSHQLQEYKLINDTFHKVLGHITQNTSIDELAPKLQKEFGLNEQEALYFTETVIKKINSEL